jgi:hypothetical protein
MHISEFKKAIKPSEAIENVLRNTNSRFVWFPVINKKGSKFEIGGCYHNGRLEIKASIPFYEENGEPKFYKINSYMTTQFSICCGVSIHPKDGLSLPFEEFKKAVENKDFTKSGKVVEERVETRIVKYTEIKL